MTWSDTRFLGLSQEGNIRGDVALIIPEPIAKTRYKQPIFDPHTDLGAYCEYQYGEQQEWQGCNQETCTTQYAKHGCVDGVSDQAIGSRHYKFVIGAETSINSPLASEGAHTGPGKEACEQEKDDGKRNPPTGHRSLPELVLP